MENTTADRERPVGQPKVLLVEDNPAMRALIRSLVEQITPVVHECDDGQAAVEAYEGLQPDCVLMDIKMAGLDGIAATRELRSVDPAAKVVIVTGHGGKEYRTAAEAAGACAFLLKENLLELPSLLRSVLHVPLEPGAR
ncbi:MAG: response regulator [Gemmatimonadota bacterium]|jgi:CheY-like chemotaxis protein